MVTLALLAKTNILAFRSPAIVVAGALAGQIIALAIGVTVTFSLAVGSPVLCRAFGVTASSKVSMTTAAFIWPDTHLIVLAGEVAFTEGCQTFSS